MCGYSSVQLWGSFALCINNPKYVFFHFHFHFLLFFIFFPHSLSQTQLPLSQEDSLAPLVPGHLALKGAERSLLTRFQSSPSTTSTTSSFFRRTRPMVKIGVLDCSSSCTLSRHCHLQSLGRAQEGASFVLSENKLRGGDLQSVQNDRDHQPLWESG